MRVEKSWMILREIRFSSSLFSSFPVFSGRPSYHLSFCHAFSLFTIQKHQNPPFSLTRPFRKSGNLEAKGEWLQTECRKNTLHFRKLYISFSKNRQNVPGTILFRAPNNIVCRLKQYSFTCQTQLFRARKSNLWKLKRKNTGFLSPEGVPCQQIGR